MVPFSFRARGLGSAHAGPPGDDGIPCRLRQWRHRWGAVTLPVPPQPPP